MQIEEAYEIIAFSFSCCQLSNNKVSVSDRKDVLGSAVVLSATDYYAFGKAQPGRSYLGNSDIKVGFNGKRKDDDGEFGLTAYDYGFRIYNPDIGKFLSVDPLTKAYPMLTPYQFASNTPIQAIDLDGLEAFYVHGTWSNPQTFPQVTKTTANSIFQNTEGKTFAWSGNNSDAARQGAARNLAEHVIRYRDSNQSLTLIGHSHGGNVAIVAANILKEEHEIDVDNVLTINTPVREYQLSNSVTSRHFNVFHTGDPVQANGGNDHVIPDRIERDGNTLIPIYLGGLEFPAGEAGEAGRRFNGAFNIEVEGFQGTLLKKAENFHNTHTKPHLFSNQLRNVVNLDISKLKFSPLTPSTVPQDNTRRPKHRLDTNKNP